MPRRRRFGWLKALAALIAVLVVTGAAVAAWTLRDIPWREVVDGGAGSVIVLQDANGEMIVQQGAFQAPYAEREAFPDHLVAAVLSAEDQRFYDHPGIDIRGIARAAFRNILAGEVVQGGSTITQQLVKIQYLEPERTFKRKFQEAVVALWLEQRLDKDEILTRYLNGVYMGSGATGMPAAAKTYFDKEMSELTVAESAILAGAIRAPSRLNPITDIEAARNGARAVLGAMARDGRIADDEAQYHSLELARLHPTPPEEDTGTWFSDWAMKEARALAGSVDGTTLVRTTLVPELQRLAEEAVAQGLAGQEGEGQASQAALVAMRPDGAVVAMVGGDEYATDGFNRAISAQRQPGSTFKLFVYYAALKVGYGLRDRIEDRPFEIDGWSPENFDGRYRGTVTLATAFARSLNAASARLAQEVGIDAVIDAARELGIDAELAENPSLALGTSEVSLLDLTAAYASVRAGEAPIEPWSVAELRASGHEEAFRVGPRDENRAPLGAHRDELVKLLQLTVERGTGRNAALEAAFAAGKTGTSQNYRDAWFIGFTEELVVGVWLGNDDGTPMKDVTGGTAPAAIWKRFMQGANGHFDARVADVGEDSEEVVRRSVSDRVRQRAACDIRACRSEFRSFRASDCTYQPYSGPRQLCPYGTDGQAEDGNTIVLSSEEPDETSARRCDIPACQSRYDSFRASDCTYQPYGGGPRELCTLGAAEPAGEDGTAAAADGAPTRVRSCNVRACERSYRSFRASDCTYQPYGGGPRRLCDR